MAFDETKHPDYMPEGQAKKLVDDDQKTHGNVKDDLGDPRQRHDDVPKADHANGQPDWAKAGKAAPDHWKQVGDTWQHDTEG